MLEALIARYPGAHGRYLERLIVKRDDSWIPIPLDRVRRLSADGKHVRIHADGGPHVVRDSLRELEARLDPAQFVRVHRGAAFGRSGRSRVRWRTRARLRSPSLRPHGESVRSASNAAVRGA